MRREGLGWFLKAAEEEVPSAASRRKLNPQKLL